MLDARFVRENIDTLKNALQKRGSDIGLSEFLSLEEERLKFLKEAEELRNKRNVVSEEIGNLKKQKQDAEKLAKLLVEKRLAACINILKIEKSVYRWKGKIAEEGEYLLLIKSAKAYEKLEREIRTNHPYKLPEIIRLNVNGGYKKYLSWIARPK